MPPDSALRRELTGEWSLDNELAALGLELAHEQLRVSLGVGGVKHNKLPKPLRIPRPEPMAPPNKSSASRPSTGRRHASSVGEVVAVLSAGFGSARR